MVSNPEFLREGHAVHDFFHPDRIVIGCEDGKARRIMEQIYRPLYLIQTPFVWCTIETAEIIKYACNSFLATKIAFINETANLCESVGADYPHHRPRHGDGRQNQPQIPLSRTRLRRKLSSQGHQRDGQYG